MGTTIMVQPLSYIELENIYGGLNWKAALDTVVGAAAVCGGIVSGNPIAIVGGCFETGYAIGQIFNG